MLDEMVPLDMTFEAEVLYNTHRKLSEYPHCVLAQFTHTELYSEELKRSCNRHNCIRSKAGGDNRRIQDKPNE